MEYQDVVRALIGIGPGAVDILVEDLNAAGPEVRWRAAVALGHICDARAVDALCAALEDPDDQLRFFAAEALGRIGDPKAVEALLRMSRRDTGRVRVYWEDSLRGEWIDTPLRAVAVTALGAIGDERPVDSLLEILEDQGADPQVDTIYGKQAYPLRATVVQALGCIGSARARSALLAVANDDDFRVRQAAALALRRTQAGGDVEP